MPLSISDVAEYILTIRSYKYTYEWVYSGLIFSQRIIMYLQFFVLKANCFKRCRPNGLRDAG